MFRKSLELVASKVASFIISALHNACSLKKNIFQGSSFLGGFSVMVRVFGCPRHCQKHIMLGFDHSFSTKQQGPCCHPPLPLWLHPIDSSWNEFTKSQTFRRSWKRGIAIKDSMKSCQSGYHPNGRNGPNSNRPDRVG